MMVDRTRLLTDVEVVDGLVEVAGWEWAGDRIVRDFAFPTFVRAFAFMTGVALLAEQLDHHPEWSNVYGSVRIELTNHDAGGVTELDLYMAAEINRLV
jgi:4a-hydroxytetrahydrobiopterin dehydratase